MPHYNGIVDGASPPNYPKRKPKEFEEQVETDAREAGLTLVKLLWSDKRGSWKALVTIDGEKSAVRRFVENTLDGEVVSLNSDEKARE